MKPSTIAKVLPTLMESKTSVFLWGKSGIGKSSVVKQIAKKLNLKINDVRLSQLDSIDLRGFPCPDMANGKMHWLPADFLPKETDPPGILFLDECNAALPAVASGAYQLVLDRAIGNYRLPDHWSIVAAGNNIGDRGITHSMPAPLNNRFIHLDFELDVDDWSKHAQEDGIHRNIRSYIRFQPGSLHDFDAAINPRSFPTPRSWYMVNTIYNSGYSSADTFEILKGVIGEGHAAKFVGFCRDIATMPDIDSILLNPEKAKLPGSQAVMHAVVTTLVDDKTTTANFDRIMKYVARLPREIQVVYVRSSLVKDEDISQCDTYKDWGLANQDILM